MAEQAAHSDAIGIEFAVGQLPAREIGGHRRVEIDPAVLHQRHDAPCSEPLAERCDLKQRITVDRIALRQSEAADLAAIFEHHEGQIAAIIRHRTGLRRGDEGLRVVAFNKWTAQPALAQGREDERRPRHTDRKRSQDQKPIAFHPTLPVAAPSSSAASA